jgi:hypothetical protein
MIDPKIRDISGRMTAAKLDSRWVALERSITRRLLQLQGEGQGRSGAAAEAIGDICAAEAQSAVPISWQYIWRAVLNIGVTPSSDLADELKAEIRAQTEQHFRRLKAVVSDHIHRMGLSPDLVHDSLTKARDLALSMADPEVDLALTSVERRLRTEKAETIYQFYAPVGAVVSGANASASVVQNMSAQARADLGAALESLAEAIFSATEIRNQQERGEVVELVSDARRELHRPTPNGWRLISLLQGIGGAVQTVGSALPAYEALKAAARMAGIELP